MSPPDNKAKPGLYLGSRVSKADFWLPFFFYVADMRRQKPFCCCPMSILCSLFVLFSCSINIGDFRVFASLDMKRIRKICCHRRPLPLDNCLFVSPMSSPLFYAGNRSIKRSFLFKLQEQRKRRFYASLFFVKEKPCPELVRLLPVKNWLFFGGKRGAGKIISAIIYHTFKHTFAVFSFFSPKEVLLPLLLFFFLFFVCSNMRFLLLFCL